MGKRSLFVIILMGMYIPLISAADSSPSRNSISIIFTAVAVLILATAGYFLLRRKKDN